MEAGGLPMHMCVASGELWGAAQGLLVWCGGWSERGMQPRMLARSTSAAYCATGPSHLINITLLVKMRAQDEPASVGFASIPMFSVLKWNRPSLAISKQNNPCVRRAPGACLHHLPPASWHINQTSPFPKHPRPPCLML